VHDVGKIGIPAEILVKPAALSEDEYALVKTHAANGFAILRKIDFELPIAEIVLQHHERMDGSGYPAGLAGDAILPEARVIAAADVIESMASHRPYRPARGIDAAVAELQEGSGRLYDPAVAAAVARIHARGELADLLALE
jgi:HD-GYP domain-containing protein (c-di-GMP phosphodiesterase class II)